MIYFLVDTFSNYLTMEKDIGLRKSWALIPSKLELLLVKTAIFPMPTKRGKIGHQNIYVKPLSQIEGPRSLVSRGGNAKDRYV